MTDTQRRIISAIRAGYARQDAIGAIIGARFTITPKGEQAYRWMQ